MLQPTSTVIKALTNSLHRQNKQLIAQMKIAFSVVSFQSQLSLIVAASSSLTLRKLLRVSMGWIRLGFIRGKL